MADTEVNKTHNKLLHWIFNLLHSVKTSEFLRYVGVDVHKKRWVVSIRSFDLELKTFSMQAVAEELEKFFDL